jgi:hypothetical protein
MFGKKKEEVVEEVKKSDEDWMTKKWRPMMAMMYMICCLMDFAIFPIMFTIVQFWETQAANDAFRQWVPITLQGGGLFHVAMGGVLGVTAYGRTQEKLGGATNAPTSTPSVSPAPSLSSPVPSVASAPAPSWSSPPPQATAVYAAATPTPAFEQPLNNVSAGFGGKKAPPAAPEPLL